MHTTGDNAIQTKTVEVWDLSLRLFHWLLVGIFITAWWFEGRDLRIHVLAGMMMAGLLLYRLVWGLIGGRYARFAQFWTSRSEIYNHAQALMHVQSGSYIGHTPIGSLMIFVLLIALFTLVMTGMALLGMQTGIGVFADCLTGLSFNTEVFIQNLHGWCLNLLWVLTGIHLAGVVVESLLQRHNLIAAMVTGKKMLKEANQ